jgi:hypothetical protein
VDRHDDAVPDPQNGPLALTAQPQVPVVHQEVYTVLLRRDRVLLRLLNQGQARDLYLIPTDLLFVVPYRSRELH